MEGSSTNTPPTSSVDPCATPNPGCPCTSLGAVSDCGTVELKLGTYVACSMGKMTCEGTTWGSCVGDTVVDRAITGGNLHIASLGPSTVCTNNPCDPYCNQFADTPTTLDAGALTAAEAGIYIAATAPNICTCNEPSNAASLYPNLSSAAKGNPASCAGNDAGTATDNCNHDTHCIGGSCQPYPVAGVNPACTQAPDYTLGLGCYDGTSWELQVCNRGYIPTPGVGHLMVAIGSGSPSTAAGACTTGTTGASWPTGPTLSGASPDVGECDIDLSRTVIGPGQCVNVSLASQCTQLDGVTPLAGLAGMADAGAAVHWAAINPSSAILPGTTPVPECDTCNNYTALAQTAVPPGLSSAASCFATTCGTVCGGGTIAGADGGTGCHTYVSGTVYDPGGNIPLPGIAVYEPNAPLPAFTPGVSCDTCSTVLPPAANIVGSTFSDLTGSFDLEVDAISGIPVVFQTGRWRREITIGTDTPVLTPCAVNNITVPADCYSPGTATQPAAWPAANCKTRLPQTHAEGDIPLTAFVTGSREPFECSIAKFMGGSSEFGTGGASRMQLFKDTGTANVTAPALSGSAASVGTPPLTASGTGWIVTSLGPVLVTNLSSSNAGGTRESIAKGPPVSVTGLASLTSAYKNGTLTIWGGASAGDNGSFPILTVPSATSATITNGGAANDARSGSNSFHWAAAGPAGPLTAAYVGGTLALGGGQSAGNTGSSFPITSAPSSTSVTITNASAAVDAKNGQSTLTWTATGPGSLTLSGLSGLTAAYVGKSITLSGAFDGGNNGSFPIVSVLSATQVTITNANAVGSDKNNGAIAWSIPSTAASLPDSTTLWPSLGTYDEVVLPCGGQTSDVATLGSGGTSTTAQTDVYNWLKAGGRLFGNHWSAFGLLVPGTSGGNSVAPWNATSTFQGSFQSAPTNTAMTGRVAPGGGIKTPQQNFKTWLTTEGAYGNGTTTIGVSTPQPVAGEALVPSASNSFEWLRGSATALSSDNWTSVPGGNYSLIYSFDTNASGIVPTLQVDGGAGAGCGRTIVSDMHVDVSRANGSFAATTFPGACLLSPGLSPNEQAFEYLMFVLSSCAVGGAPILVSAPPPPPLASSLTPVTFTRTYQASCPTMTAPVWQAFSWQAEIPAGTSIVFQAQTAADASGSPGTFGAPVQVGTASTTTTTWTTSPATVDQDLRAASPTQTSLAWLRMTMTFNPSGTASPVLEQWKLTYDCMPSE
jgi:hypothetical protein